MQGRIRKRGEGTWEITINIGRDSQGRRQRRFENVKGTKAAA